MDNTTLENACAVHSHEQSMNQLIEQTKDTENPKPFRFLDLPGELRNKIYEYELSSGPTLLTAIALMSSCRQIRSEYRPLYFQSAQVHVPFYLAQRFLEIFHPTDALDVMKRYTYKIHLKITEDIPRERVIIDMQRLVGTLLDRPGIEVTLSGIGVFHVVAKDLEKLLEVAQSNAAWRDHMAGFESITLPIGAGYRPVEVGHLPIGAGGFLSLGAGFLPITIDHSYGINQRPAPWVLEFLLKPDNSESWWYDRAERRNRISELLTDMGLLETTGPDQGPTPFLCLNIAVCKKEKYSDGQNRVRYEYW